MKKVLFIPILLIFVTLPTVLPFFNNRFFYTQDYIFIARLQQMSTVLSQGQFPVRWAPDLRYGEPVFNFYAPLPYYIGAVIHLLGLDFIWTAKMLFVLSSILSAIAMYVLVNRLFGKRAGILAAILYTYAPYRAVDMYVRGSLSETWAFIFLPLIFYSSLVLAEKVSLKNISFLSFSLAGLFLTHNVTTLMFTPFLCLWWIYLIFRQKNWKTAGYLGLASVLGLGLAAFFLLPAFFENNLIQTKYLTVGYFNFRAHFVAFSQFFSTFWGYGSSLWGRDDGLSFQVGLVNFSVLALAFIIGIFHRKNKKLLALLSILGLSFVFSLFLQHNKSSFIWEVVPEMAFIQFPWRFLGISIFITALAGGVITPYLKNRLQLVYIVLIFFAVFSTLGYFRPKEYVNDSFFNKFLSTSAMHKGEDLTKDYLPIWVQTTDGDRFDNPRAVQGEIKVSNIQRSSTLMQFSADISENSLIEIPVTYFPGWEINANNQFIPQNAPSEMGLIKFVLPKGNYTVTAQFNNTLIRTIGNTVSLGSIFLVAVSLIFKRNRLGGSVKEK